MSGSKNKYLFQGQEHQDELGLGWVQFKWRNHDPALGRFFNIDPLAHDYVYNSPYAFSENKVVAHVELEGLESSPYPKPGYAPGGAKSPYTPSSNANKDVNITWEGFVNGSFGAKVQFVLYGNGGEEVVGTNERSDNRETIVVDMQNDLPSPLGKGVKGGNTFKSALESYSEFMSFSDKAVKTINEVQDNSNTSSNETSNVSPVNASTYPFDPGAVESMPEGTNSQGSKILNSNDSLRERRYYDNGVKIQTDTFRIK